MASLTDVNAILAWNLRGDASAVDRRGQDENFCAIDAAAPTAKVSHSSVQQSSLSFVTDSSLVTQMRLFVEENKLPASSPNFRAMDAEDDLSMLVEAARRIGQLQTAAGAVATGRTDADHNTSTSTAPGGPAVHEIDVFRFAYLCCSALKILSRKQVNRVAFGKCGGVRAVVSLLRRFNGDNAGDMVLLGEGDEGEEGRACPLDGHDPTPSSSASSSLLSSTRRGQNRDAACVQAEAANIILNVCYEKANVELVLEHGGVPELLTLMASNDPVLQANAAGAIQSVCYQKCGRRTLVGLGGVPTLLALLASDDMKVKSRSIGSLHNLSSDAEAIKIIRRKGGIDGIIALLQYAKKIECVEGSAAAEDSTERAMRVAIVAAAAGTLQNLCREVASRDIVSSDKQAVSLLTEILFGEDVHAQVCAAGALITIIGPELEQNDEHKNKHLAAMQRADERFIQHEQAIGKLIRGAESRAEVGGGGTDKKLFHNGIQLEKLKDGATKAEF